MQSYEIRCQNCGKKLLTYSQSSFRKYESPVKKCKKCGFRYADPRCHEIAIEGIPADTFHIPSYLLMLVIGGLILARGVYLFGMRQIGISGRMQWLLPSVFVVFGVILTIGAIIEIISIISGRKAQKFDKRRRESEARLRDKGYIYMLQDLGYQIPEKYL